MKTVRLANSKDIEFLEKHDSHISYEILCQRIENKSVYILEVDGEVVGWLRYNLFWDNTPFMNMLYILEEYRKQGFGKYLLEHWENQMKVSGFPEVMTSTLVHEDAIHFYLKYGYQAVGGFHPTSNEYEIILKKRLSLEKIEC